MTTIARQSRLLTVLDGSGHLATEVGDRAAILDRLLAFGFPIPDSVVLTTAAYHEAIGVHNIKLLVNDLRTSSLPDQDHVAAESAAVERSFLSFQLPPRLERNIGRVVEELGSDGPVTVNCSVVHEDAGASTPPGCYLSVPRANDRAGLERAIRQVWASLWTPTAREHRRRHHMHDHHIAMAVVVQKMIEPRWAGTAHTTAPDGPEHLLRIDAAEQASAERSFLLRKDTLEPVAGMPKAPSFLEDLARIIVRVENALESPFEVSWALDDSGIVILDATPSDNRIDASGVNDGFDSKAAPADTYTPHGVIEMLPGVVPPLLWTINAPMLENAFRAAFADLGATTPDSGRHIVARVRGRAALNLSAICRVAESLPGGDPTEVERQYLGYRVLPDTPGATTGAPAQGSGVHLFAALRSRQVHRRIIDDVELIDTAARTIANLSVELSELPVRNLVAYRQRIRDLAWRGYAAEVGASSAAGATYRALELLLARWLPEPEAEHWAQRLTRTAIDASTLGGLRAVDLVAALDAYGTEEIREIIASEPADPRREIAALGPIGSRFIRHVDGAVRAMGSKALYGDKTWAEDDAWVWRQLALLQSAPRARRSESDRESEYTELIDKLSRDRKWRRLRILTGQFVDLRARWLRRQVDETTAFLELREQAKNALLILGGEERRVVVEAAHRLIASRQLPSVDLVDYVTDSELDDMLFGSCAVEFSELERRRAVGIGCSDVGPLPDWFAGDQTHYYYDAAAHEDDVIAGRGTSPGQATGPARVVTSLTDGVRLNPGDVLVAHSTDPSWTPLFMSACAVILETGGPLSHASIVAREFGLPAVVNVPGATRTLSDGEVVSVDGTAGTVTRTGGGGP